MSTVLCMCCVYEPVLTPLVCLICTCQTEKSLKRRVGVSQSSPLFPDQKVGYFKSSLICKIFQALKRLFPKNCNTMQQKSGSINAYVTFWKPFNRNCDTTELLRRQMFILYINTHCKTGTEHNLLISTQSWCIIKLNCYVTE